MRIAPTLTALFAVAAITMVATGALPLLDDAGKQRFSTNIVTGQVVSVYTATSNNGKGFVDQRYAIEVKVTGSQKGSIKAGEIIADRCRAN